MNRKPVTITIDPEIKKQIRILQTKFIIESGSTWSFSMVVHEILIEGLKRFDTKKFKKR